MSSMGNHCAALVRRRNKFLAVSESSRLAFRRWTPIRGEVQLVACSDCAKGML